MTELFGNLFSVLHQYRPIYWNLARLSKMEPFPQPIFHFSVLAWRCLFRSLLPSLPDASVWRAVSSRSRFSRQLREMFSCLAATRWLHFGSARYLFSSSCFLNSYIFAHPLAHFRISLWLLKVAKFLTQ